MGAIIQRSYRKGVVENVCTKPTKRDAIRFLASIQQFHFRARCRGPQVYRGAQDGRGRGARIGKSSQPKTLE